MFQYFCIIFAIEVSLVTGHGRMIDPPSRASMFRFGYNNPPNYNDNECNCGGFRVQQENGGKCGICGDPYFGTRHHEAGGRYANGIITGSYRPGQVIQIVIDITANHLGYFVFKLCPNNNVNQVATQKCLDENTLELADRSGTKYHINSRLGKYEINLKLPDDLVCSQCVLQWMYRCGNNHGTAANGTACLGCGPQEEFYACSDIEILSNGGQGVSQTPVTVSQTPVTVSQTPVAVSQTPVTASETPVTVSQTPVTVSQTPMTVSQTPMTVSPTSRPFAGLPQINKNCYSINSFSTLGMGADMWCKYNCVFGFCPKAMCKCPDDDSPAEDCVANDVFRGDPLVDIWCRSNCGFGFCPISHCLCSPS